MKQAIRYAITSIESFANSNQSDYFRQIWFHPKELKEPFNNRNLQSLAARYAMKIALKGLFHNLQDVNQIYIKNKTNGRPYISKKHTSRSLITNFCLAEVLFSLTHTPLFAAALVVSTKNENRTDYISCGIDLEKIERFKKYTIHPILGKGFIHLVYSTNEQNHYNSLDTLGCYVTAFCCKEAIFKSLMISNSKSPINWHEIEVFFPENSLQKPQIKLSGSAKQIFQDLNASTIDFDITTHHGHIVIGALLF